MAKAKRNKLPANRRLKPTAKEPVTKLALLMTDGSKLSIIKSKNKIKTVSKDKKE